ncbi:hypothetical protein [Candidatus Darwinibacter acetoxidans]|jgi:hypothetical protein
MKINVSSHVLLCWLGMLLIRIAEQETGQTWFQIKKALSGQEQHLGKFCPKA